MKRFLILIISFITFLTLPVLCAAEAEERSDRASTLQEILILNSYHPGYAWSDDEQAGIIDVLRAKDENWLPVIEYLDLKRLPDGRHLAKLKQLFRSKYQNKKFSVVIAMDNPALEFAMDNQAELFRNAPIVFCGINDYKPSLLQGRSNVTGIAEANDIAGTIEVMLRLHPDTREIFSLHDYTATGLALRKELDALAPRFGKVRFRFTDPLTMGELLKEIERLPKDTLILEIGFIADKSGRTFGISETTKLFYEHSSVPIYSTFEQRLGSGIVGGKLMSARIHGVNAARIALRVSAGEKASAIPVVLESDSRFMFDYKVMSRFGIPLSALPEGSTVINKPISFYAAHRVFSQTALGVIVFLAVVISLLTINIIQRRRSAIALSASKEALSLEHAKLQAILDYSPALISVKDLHGNVILANRNFAVLDVPPLHEFVGRNVFELFPREVAENLWNNAQSAFKAGGPVEFEEIVQHKDGKWHTYLTVKFPVYEESGQPFGICAISNDITERKEAEKRLRRSEENFRRSLDDSPLGVRIVTAEGDTIYANRSFLDLYGYDSIEELNTVPVRKRYTPESYAEYQVRREKRKQGDDVQSEYEIGIFGKVKRSFKQFIRTSPSANVWKKGCGRARNNSIPPKSFRPTVLPYFGPCAMPRGGSSISLGCTRMPRLHA
jgi:PAS domain S-box-containing protein